MEKGKTGMLPNKHSRDSILTSQLNEDEKNDEASLRPTRLDDYVGQPKIKENLKIYIEAAKRRHEALDHVIFYGPPGLGKTTLAHIIAREMGVNIRVTSGPALEKKGDLVGILTNLQAGDVFFIDETPRLTAAVEESLSPAMEDSFVDLVLGSGPHATTHKIQLEPFTLI